VLRARADWVLTVAAGISDITSAASIINKLNGILAFIAFSFLKTKTMMSRINTNKPKPSFPH
jgi:enoyl reductase-like protein